ncbi:MAG: ABC transporter permease [Acidobacteria bacterium]|nr:ABC transporter permease [Acidobacteriota bacterium]
MDKVKVVAMRELMTHLKRPSFWWMTFGMPILLLALGLAIAAISAFAIASSDDDEGESEEPPMAVVDHAGLVNLAQLNSVASNDVDVEDMAKVLDELEVRDSIKDWLKKRVFESFQPAEAREFYRSYPDEEQAEADLIKDELSAVLILDADFRNTYHARLIQRDRKEDRVSVREIEAHLRDNLLAELVSPDRVRLVKRPLTDLERTYLDPTTPPDELNRIMEGIKVYLLPLMLIMMMLFALLGTTDRMIRGMVEEKQNRVIEVLLSSVSADQLMAGKVLGLGAVGMVQLVIWNAGVILPMGMLAGIFKLGIGTWLVFGVFFVMGYFLLATIILGFGSLGANLQEAGQWYMVFVMLALSPMFMLPNILEDPTGLIARILTYFPLSAPITVVARLGSESIGWWEGTLSGLVLLGSIVIAIRISAKVFRIGILMTGKTPNPIELWRAWRHS